MNNQGYEIPNVETNFSHNAAMDSNENPLLLHGNGQNDLTFSQDNFSMTDVYYEGVSSQKTSSNILNEPVQNPLGQHVAFEGNVEQNFTTSNQIIQPYCSQFPNQMPSPLPYSDSFQPQDQFVCNVPQPQMFSGVLPNLFSNANCSSSQQTPADSVGNFSDTSEYLNCNSKPPYLNMVPNDPVQTNLYPANNEIDQTTFPHAEMCQNLNETPRSIELDKNEKFSPLPVENVDKNADIPAPFDGEISAQFGSENTLQSCSAEPSNQSRNDSVPHSNSEGLPSQLDYNDFPHSNSEEVSSRPTENGEPYSNSEEVLCQDDNNHVPHSYIGEVSSQLNNDVAPHSNNEEFPCETSNEENLFDPLQIEDGESSQIIASTNVEGSENKSLSDITEKCDNVTSENGEETSKPDHLREIGNATDAIVSVNTEEMMSSSNKNKDVDLSVECGSTMETLDDLSDSLEKGIEASLGESNEASVAEGAISTPRPLSPMITAIDREFFEPKKEATESTDNVRLTRTRTGALRNKTQRYIDEIDDTSQESILYEEWQYEEGAELAPSFVDPSITVQEDVLKVTPTELANYYEHFKDGFDDVLKQRLHCTSCDKHIGAAPNFIHLGNRHKVLRVLICNTCRSFYGAGKFNKDSDGSELFCRWCGQGGQVICCSSCPNVFCQLCIRRNIGEEYLNTVTASNFWACFLCNYKLLWPLRAVCWALLTYTMKKKKEAINSKDTKKVQELQDDKSKCCPRQNKKRKPPTKTKSVRPSSSVPGTAQQDGNLNGIQFGHFLFDNEDSSNAMGTEHHTEETTTADDDEYIDPSQFVQSVLEEPRRSQPRILAKPTTSRHGSQVPVRPFIKVRSPQGLNSQFRPVTLQTNPPRTVRTVYSHTPPQLFVRQGNLMQPGLLPIHNQPNSMAMPGPMRFRGPSNILRNNVPIRPQQSILRTDVPTGLQSSTNRNLSRNPSCVLNNMDGVRSMEQIQALDQVPWYRDGIDSVRSVGFALNKRIRELEARFHSLKNKQDIDKVMNLGKKLERLTERSEKRFKKINASLKDACREWCAHKLANSPYALNPFGLGRDEGTSDWDDDVELSKPLEKVLIPVNSVTLQGGAIRQIQPRAISRTTPPPLAALPVNFRPGVPQILASMAAQPAPSGPVPSVSYSIRLPGPKSSAGRYIQVGHNITQTVGSLLNKRNGPNSVSISLAPVSKRKRLDSGSSDSSDVMVCHTIPELIKIHNIKPCKVVLEKGDDFIVSFLERQEQLRSERSILIANEVEPVMNPQISMIDPEAEDVISSSEFPDHFLSPLVEISSTHEKQADTTTSQTTSSCAAPVDDDDDDIEIIDEVSVAK